MMWSKTIIAVVLVILAGCMEEKTSTDDFNEGDTVTDLYRLVDMESPSLVTDMDSLRLLTIEKAEEDAKDCGFVFIGINDINSADDANCCVAMSYLQSVPFYVTYQIQGIDSVGGESFILSRDGVIDHLNWDSYGSGRLHEGTCDRIAFDNEICSIPVPIPRCV